MNLTDRVAIVTGAGRGIGQAIAVKLATHGARVVVNDLDPEPAAETVTLIEKAGGQAVAVTGSVTAPELAAQLVDAAAGGLGGLDIIVNNAGYTWDAVIQKTTDEQWAAILDVHLTGPFRLLRAAQPVLKRLTEAERAAGRAHHRKVGCRLPALHARSRLHHRRSPGLRRRLHLLTSSDASQGRKFTLPG